MKLLLVLDVLDENGAVRVDLDLARRWTSAGHPTTVLALQPVPQGRTAPTEGVDVVLGTPRIERFRSAVLRIVPRVLARARAADVVVSGSEFGEGLVLAQWAARLLRKPFVVIVHASPSYMLERFTSPRLGRLSRTALSRADAAVCVSADLVDEVVALGVPAQHVTHIANGRDVLDLRERAAAVRADLPADREPVVVGLGRLTEQKGFDLLVRAHARVRAAVPHRLRIAGEGPLRADLEALVRELGVDDTVDLTGFTTDAPAVVAPAALYCLPSRHEGQPLALLEAMAMGVPVVAADCGVGVRELVGGGAYGDLVPTDSVEALAEALERHLRAPEVLEGKVAAASTHLDGYGSEAMAQAYLGVLRPLARGR